MMKERTVPCRMYSNSRRSTFPGAKGKTRMFALQGLYSGQLISAHHSLPRLDQGGSFSVQIADVSDFGVIVEQRGDELPDEAWREITVAQGFRSPFLEAWPHDGGKSVLRCLFR